MYLERLKKERFIEHNKVSFLLLIGAIINFILCVGHLACLVCLKRVFEIYSISDTMNGLSDKYGGCIIYVITFMIAFCFFMCGMYGLSACGRIRKLPLLRLGTYTIAAVFLFRCIYGISILISSFTYLELSSTSVSALIGVSYLLGGLKIPYKSIRK